MKQLLSILALTFLLMGCKTDRGLKSLAAAQDMHYAAKKAWIAYCHAEYDRLDQLPATEQIYPREKLAARRKNAIALSQRFDEVWDLAWAAAKLDRNAPAPPEVLRALADFKLATQ